MRRRILPVVLCFTSLLLPGPASGQAVDLLLREDSTGLAIPGAIVRLMLNGVAVAQALTSETGRATLRAAAAGTYRLRVDRIGWSGTLTEPFALAAGETVRRELGLSSLRIMLPTLVVQAERNCHTRLEEGVPAAALWEEIRKSLTANVITQRLRAAPLYVRDFRRELSHTGQVEREWTIATRVVHGAPYAALPPDTLATRGFVTTSGAEVTFAAPDAALLLSDQFVATHCFRAVRGRGELIGLAFEPVEKRRVSDVVGTLWVDERSGQLRHLEYMYTDLVPELRYPDVGGRVEYQRLRNGAFIVSYWHIRMPRLDTRFRGGRNQYLSGYLDHGGRVDAAGRPGSASVRAVVSGRVLDSILGAGLEGTVIKVSGWTDSVITDADGRYQFAVAGAGRQMVSAKHPRLGLIRGPSSREAVLSIGDTTVIDFAMPPLAAFVQEFCGTRTTRSGLVGLTIGPEGQPEPGLEVRVRWEPEPGSSREERTRSGPRGVFALCDLPPDRLLPVRLMQGRQPLSERNVRLSQGEFRWLEVTP